MDTSITFCQIMTKCFVCPGIMSVCYLACNRLYDFVSVLNAAWGSCTPENG